MNPINLLNIASFCPASLRFPNAWVGHLPFARWIIQETSPKIFVELGTHSGNSYFSFCQSVIESGISTKCYAVDTWQGDEHAGQYNQNIFSEVNAYNEEHFVSFSRLLRMTFDDAVSYFSDGSIDLLHIDGLHTYEAVRHDFETWLPKLSPHAVVMFHDINVRERNFGVWKLWEELQARYPNNLEFVHSHGLGVLQLNNAPHEKKLEWLQPSAPEKKNFISYFSALGSRQFERYELSEQKKQITSLKQNFSELDEQIIKIKNASAERDKQIVQLTAERDAAILNLHETRHTISWKLTAPLRFFRHLVRGNFKLAGNIVCDFGRKLMRYWIPISVQGFMQRNYARLQSVTGMIPKVNPEASHPALSAIVSERCALTSAALVADPLAPPSTDVWPTIDISIVTYNSSSWITDFVNSLIKLDYPKNLLKTYFVDNSSTDSTFKDLHAAAPLIMEAGFSVEIMQCPNNGFGAGHNAAICKGTSPFCLITNIDIIFEPDALRRIVAIAQADNIQAAAWELRQKPYEHPKFYDPVTGITNWNSHACILLRRSALIQVGYYDETLFMYGEDVELSYRLRRAGFLLRYCPQAVVWHYTYEKAHQIKPLQFIGSTFANLYLRLRYGNGIDMLVAPVLGLRLALAPEAYPGSRRAALRNLLKLSRVATRTLLSRRNCKSYFPFHGWDFDLVREGAFFEQQSHSFDTPLVSVITRTYHGRELYLRQALLSVAHQTYTNIEHIVVEDGGESMHPVVDNISEITGKTINFIKSDKLGRSAVGNIGLAAAKGRWCLFLDDDDLLFSDHVEILVNTLLTHADAVAAYSLAWEVTTESTRLAEGEYSEKSYGVPSSLRQDFDYDVLKHHNFMAIQSVLFERNLFSKLGGFETDMDALEDWVLWKKYAYNNRFQYVPKVTSLYRTPSRPLDIARRQKAFDKAYPTALARQPYIIK